MKKCYRCGISKPRDQFHKNARRPDGITTACKPCAIEVRKEWRVRNLERALVRDREYYKMNSDAAKKREAARKAYLPERTSAHEQLRDAIRRGLIEREPCFICGGKAEAHHSCYDLPLHVTWLCRSHHRQLHADANGHV